MPVVATLVLAARFWLLTDIISCLATPHPAPSLDNPLPTLTVDAGVYFEFVIPVDTFSDTEDGDTRNLSLTLSTADGQVSIYLLRVKSTGLYLCDVT